MRFTLATVAALVAPIIADTITPAPTTTSDGWFDGVPPWATSDPAKWSSIYNSLLSEGKIPSTLTAVPWPTGSYGPGQGPWGPGHGPGGGPGHWGGTLNISIYPSMFFFFACIHTIIPHIPIPISMHPCPRRKKSKPNSPNYISTN